MKSALHHIAIASPDPAALADFYTTTLGLEEVYRRTDGTGRVESIWLALGPGAVLMIERASSSGSDSEPTANESPADFHAKSRGPHLIALRIAPDERESYAERLSTVGVAIIDRSEYSVYFRDPDRNRVALSWLDYEAFLKEI